MVRFSLSPHSVTPSLPFPVHCQISRISFMLSSRYNSHHYTAGCPLKTTSLQEHAAIIRLLRIPPFCPPTIHVIPIQISRTFRPYIHPSFPLLLSCTYRQKPSTDVLLSLPRALLGPNHPLPPRCSVRPPARAKPPAHRRALFGCGDRARC